MWKPIRIYSTVDSGGIMKSFQYSDIPPTIFETDQVKGIAARVLIGKQDGAVNFCMRIFEIASGGNTPRHSHNWEHEMFIHSGSGELYGNGKWNSIASGTAVFIPSNEEHQMRNTGKDPLIVLCLVPSHAPEL
jgi:quercetin dioxygenase-like cupin family protein